jgi:hypothetical protein
MIREAEKHEEVFCVVCIKETQLKKHCPFNNLADCVTQGVSCLLAHNIKAHKYPGAYRSEVITISPK